MEKYCSEFTSSSYTECNLFLWLSRPIYYCFGLFGLLKRELHDGSIDCELNLNFLFNLSAALMLGLRTVRARVYSAVVYSFVDP